MKIELNVRLASEGLPQDDEDVIVTWEYNGKHYMAAALYVEKKQAFLDDSEEYIPESMIATWIPVSEYCKTIQEAIAEEA